MVCQNPPRCDIPNKLPIPHQRLAHRLGLDVEPVRGIGRPAHGLGIEFDLERVKVSGTKRTPIGRPPRPIISERVVKLFKQGIALLHNGGDRDAAEMRWISIALHRELGLKPWHDDVFDLDIDTPVPERLHTQFDIDQFCHVRDLRRQLAAIT